ncbi:hypothetical protein GCM10022276_07860 [Sphingomonas limnosediminicola]|uniref:Uncharacterized protein n=1 Tax=Sphingomonas limnosediminicola TaxID=940133 RepID=A0ABP7KYA0_9SPHN
MGFKQGTILGRARLCPGIKAAFVYEVDQPGFLPAVGRNQRSEISHPAALAKPRRNRKPSGGHAEQVMLVRILDLHADDVAGL